MKTGTKYCLYCLKTGNNIGQYPCSCSPNGAHRIVAKGEKRYRVKSKSSGFVFLLRSVPEEFELIEEITY